MTDITSEPSLKAKKKLLPRMSILIPGLLVLALAYLFYFNPTFLPNNLKKNLISNNNPNKNLSSQNEINPDSLIGGSTDQIAANQIDSEPIFAASIDNDFDNQLESIQKELQSLKNKLTKLNSSDKLNLSGGELSGTLEIQDNLTLNSIAKTESIIPQADDNYDLGSSDKGWDNAYIHTLYGSSILTIGDGETSHSLTDMDDLLISGKLEVNGNSYFDGNTIFGGTIDAGNNLISNLADPINAQDAVTKAYYEANTPTGVFSRTGTTISPTTAGDSLDMTGELITFDPTQTFGGSTLTQLGYLSGVSGLGSLAQQTSSNVTITGGLLSGITSLNGINNTTLGYLSGVDSNIQTQFSDLDIDIATLDTGKEDSLTKGDVNAGTGISISGDTADAVIGDGITISIPQSIATSATPTFAGLTLGASGLNMSYNLITNIGHTDTNFTEGGGLDLAGDLEVGVGGTGTFLGGVTINNGLGVAGNITIADGSLDISGTTLDPDIKVKSQTAGTSGQQFKAYDHYANNNGIAALGLYKSCGTIDSPANIIFPTCAGHVGGMVSYAWNNGDYRQTNTLASLVSGLWDYKLYPNMPETWVHIGNNDNADSSTFTYGHRFVVYPEGTAVWPGGLDVIDTHVNYGFTVAGSEEIYDTTTLGNEILTAPTTFSNAVWSLAGDDSQGFFVDGTQMHYNWRQESGQNTGEFTQAIANFANPAPNGARFVIDVDYVISACGTANANLDYFLVNTDFAKTDPKEASSANINTSLTMWNMPTGQGGTLIGVGAGGYFNDDTGQKYGGTSYQTLVTGADNITGITIKVKAHSTCQVIVSKVSVKEVKGGDLHLSGDINVGEDANIAGKLNINDSIITGKRPGGLAPTVNEDCGTGALVVGNDISGVVTIGSASVTNNCAVTFNSAYSNTPVCVLTSDTDGDLIIYNTLTTGFVIRRAASNPASVNSMVSYICMGQN